MIGSCAWNSNGRRSRRLAIFVRFWCGRLLLNYVLQELRIRNKENATVPTADGRHGVAYALDRSGDAVEADLVALGYAFRDVPARGYVLRNSSKPQSQSQGRR